MYKLLKDQFTGQVATVFCLTDNAFIPFDPVNTDYQVYLRWLEEGNTPLPADVEATPPQQDTTES